MSQNHEGRHSARLDSSKALRELITNSTSASIDIASMML